MSRSSFEARASALLRDIHDVDLVLTDVDAATAESRGSTRNVVAVLRRMASRRRGVSGVLLIVGAAASSLAAFPSGVATAVILGAIGTGCAGLLLDLGVLVQTWQRRARSRHDA